MGNFTSALLGKIHAALTRQDGSFTFADELADKRRQLAEVEEALVKSVRDDAKAEKVAA